MLSEHEIDGESLFLVSKPQLMQIGVSEEHAEAICEFIKKWGINDLEFTYKFAGVKLLSSLILNSSCWQSKTKGSSQLL